VVLVRRYSVDTPLSIPEARDRLRSAIRTVASGDRWSLTPPEPLFTGSVTRRLVYLRRLGDQRDAFAPVLIGRLVPRQDGSRLDAIVSMSPVYLLLLTGWLCVLAVFLVISATSNAPILGKLGLAAAAVALGLFAFLLARRSGAGSSIDRDVREVLRRGPTGL
jgi:hypothetical protein